MFDGGSAVGAGGVPVALGDDAVDAEQGLEQELCDAGVLLGKRGPWMDSEIGEEAGVRGHEGAIDGGELCSDGGDLCVLGGGDGGGTVGVCHDGEGGVGAQMVRGD